MTDATDDLDYQLSGEQARFKQIDKELWDKQTKQTPKPEPTLREAIIKELDEYGLENWTYKDEFTDKILSLILSSLPEKKKTYAPTDYGKGLDDGFQETIDLIRTNLEGK